MSVLLASSLLGCSSSEPPAPPAAPAPEEGARAGKQKGGKGKRGDGAAADSCCCELLPTDVGESTFKVLPKGECTGHGPGGVYDGAKCVEDARCGG